jgi:hypothetical protein
MYAYVRSSPTWLSEDFNAQRHREDAKMRRAGSIPQATPSETRLA